MYWVFKHKKQLACDAYKFVTLYLGNEWKMDNQIGTGSASADQMAQSLDHWDNMSMNSRLECVLLRRQCPV